MPLGGGEPTSFFEVTDKFASMRLGKFWLSKIPVIHFHGLFAQFQVWLTHLDLKDLPPECVGFHPEQGQPGGIQCKN